MPARVFAFTPGAAGRYIERIVEDENVAINHIVLPPGEALPGHRANSHVYLIVIRGTLSLGLEEEVHDYPAGSIVAVPYRTMMNAGNRDGETLEFFVVKAPGPKTMAEA